MSDYEQALFEANINENIKNILSQSLKAIEHHQKSVLTELNREITHHLQINSLGKKWQIATLIASPKAENELNRRGFFALEKNSESIYHGEHSYHSDQYFLNCSYEDVNGICSKEYVGRRAQGNFSYKLVPHDRYIQLEHKLWRIKKLYEIELPLIFSPYARRAVDICLVDDIPEAEINSLDFAWDDNGLKNLIICDKILMWNIEILPFANSYDEEILAATANSSKKYRYRYVANNTVFHLPRFQDGSYNDEKIMIERNEGETIITAPEPYILKDCQPWKINAIIVDDRFPDEAKIFHNAVAKEMLLKKIRLHTRGDIDYVLQSLRQQTIEGDFIAEFSSWGNSDFERIVLYNKKFSYPVELDQELVYHRQKMPPCFIKFSGPKKYLTDYANMILYFLTEHYPEFNWIGVRT